MAPKNTCTTSAPPWRWTASACRPKNGRLPLLRAIVLVSLLAASALSLSFCNNNQANNVFGNPALYLLGPNRISVYYTDPGANEQTSVDKKIDQELIKLIDNAEKSVDMAVYNLGRDSVMDALIRAKEDRDIEVRMVGDVDEVVTDGYRKILRTKIPFSLGNSTAIQHNKFAIIDDRYVFMGTGNMTDSGFLRNNNNYMIIENPELALHYKQEFRQMYYGKYGSKKLPFSTRHDFLTNFTNFSIYYSPYQGQDAVERMIEMVDNAKVSVKYMIFAHTHDELSAAMIRAAKRGVLVQGIHDKTFIRGVSEEAPRLYSAGIYRNTGPFPRQDGNEFTSIQGLSAHGGKMHCKTLIVDDRMVSTGSFNWSGNAVENNDENMIAFENPFLAQEFLKQWQRSWELSQPITGILYHSSGDQASYGDIVISEIMWAGSYEGTTYSADDDWIELYNTTDHDIDLSHWSITWDTQETKNYPIPDGFNWYKPGVASRHYSLGRLIIPAKKYFLLKAANGAIETADNKISGTKDFSLTGSYLRLRLYDVTMNLIDEAGNGDPPYAGRLDSTNKVAYSMERFFYPTGHPKAGQALPGTSSGSWYTSNGNNQTGSNLAGLGQIQTGFDLCTAGSSGQATNCTIGTPNYSGNSSAIVSPSTATGGENNLTNIPLEAWSTSSTSASVRMRWAMQAAPTISGSICPCTASFSESDPSILTVSTQPQTAGSTYTLTVNSATDITGGSSVTDTVSFEGHGQSQAQVWIDRVYPASSSLGEDVVVIKALTNGTVHNLGIYYYDYAAPVPQLLYRMADVPITAGQYIQVRLDKTSSDTSEDRIYGASPSFDITSGSSVVSGLTASQTWEVYSHLSGISSTDGMILVTYDLDGAPQDVMCYSNRDGDVAATFMQGGLRTLYQMPSYYNLGGQLPVDEVNDAYIQAHCASFQGGGSSDYMQRTVDTNNGSDFSLQ